MKKKLIVTIVIIAAAVLMALFLRSGVWPSSGGEKHLQVSATLLNILPQARLVSSELEGCSYRVRYVYDVVRENRSKDIAEAIKAAFLADGWILNNEETRNETHALEFVVDRADAAEILGVTVSFEKETRTLITLDYGLEPCEKGFSGRGATWITASGEERGIGVLAVPGMQFISEKQDACSYQVSYIYTLVNDVDISEKLADVLKTMFNQRDWQLKAAGSEGDSKTLSFYTEKAGEPEKIDITIAFKPQAGTAISLNYQWPPCSAK